MVDEFRQFIAVGNYEAVKLGDLSVTPGSRAQVQEAAVRGRCTTILIGALMVIRVYAPDSAKHLEEHEKVMQTLKHVMQEGRMEGARRCFDVVT